MGSSFDLRLMKNVILSLFPGAYVLCARANECKTEGCIAEMGLKLATEIKNWLGNYNQDDFELNFVCYSLGGVITRAALPHLGEY